MKKLLEDKTDKNREKEIYDYLENEIYPLLEWIKNENFEMEKKDKKISLSVKIKNYSQNHSAEFKSSDQKKSGEKEETIIDWQADKNERDKLILMWSGVIFFMVIIIVGWAIMFRQSFGVAKNNGQSLFDWQKWNQTAADASKNFDSTTGRLQTMKSLLTQQAAAQNASGNNATAAPLIQEELNNIKIKILESQKTTTK